MYCLILTFFVDKVRTLSDPEISLKPIPKERKSTKKKKKKKPMMPPSANNYTCLQSGKLERPESYTPMEGPESEMGQCKRKTHVLF